MITFPNSSRLLKGTIVATDPFNPVASVSPFQCTSDTLARTPQVQSVSGGLSR
jgi:hypothetical protein